jgi:hypothetical protein
MTVEAEVLREVKKAISESIRTSLTSYNSPMIKLVTSVVDNHGQELKAIMDEAMVATINAEDFKVMVREAFTHKIAKLMVEKMDGATEKRINELRSDPVMKAKMIMAIETIVKDVGKTAAE